MCTSVQVTIVNEKYDFAQHLIIGKEGHIAGVGDCKNLPIS